MYRRVRKNAALVGLCRFLISKVYMSKIQDTGWKILVELWVVLKQTHKIDGGIDLS